MINSHVTLKINLDSERKRELAADIKNVEALVNYYRSRENCKDLILNELDQKIATAMEEKRKAEKFFELLPEKLCDAQKMGAKLRQKLREMNQSSGASKLSPEEKLKNKLSNLRNEMEKLKKENPDLYAMVVGNEAE